MKTTESPASTTTSVYAAAIGVADERESTEVWDRTVNAGQAIVWNNGSTVAMEDAPRNSCPSAPSDLDQLLGRQGRLDARNIPTVSEILKTRLLCSGPGTCPI